MAAKPEPYALQHTENSKVLHRHMLGSFAWAASAKWSAQALTWICSLIVARLLSPSDYGLITMIGVFLGLIVVLTDFGFAATLIYLPTLTRFRLQQINTLSVAVAVAAAGLASFSGSWLASFYRQPEVVKLMPVMAVGLLVSGFRAVPNALMRKQLRFRVLAGIEVAQSSLQAVTTIGLAWLGFGYWALALGVLAGTTAGAAASLVFEHPGFSLPRRSDVASVLRFSGPILISNLSWYAFSNSDFTVAGRMLGTAALGTYSMAWNLAMAPSDKIAALLQGVTPGYLARFKDEPAILRQNVLRISQGIAALVFPAAVGLALVARDFVPFALGAKWTGAIQPLIYLSLYVAVSSPSSLLPQVLYATGKPALSMWTSIIRLAVMPFSFYIGSYWGPAGIALAWLIAFPLATIPLYRWTFRTTQLRAGEYLRAFVPVFISSAAMAAAVLFIGFAVLAGSAPAARLSIEVVTGFVVYGTLLAWLKPAYIHLIRERFGWRRGS
jgi:PST family polysaccharide transporter